MTWLQKAANAGFAPAKNALVQNQQRTLAALAFLVGAAAIALNSSGSPSPEEQYQQQREQTAFFNDQSKKRDAQELKRLLGGEP
jgi:hypothetical protein